MTNTYSPMIWSSLKMLMPFVFVLILILILRRFSGNYFRDIKKISRSYWIKGGLIGAITGFVFIFFNLFVYEHEPESVLSEILIFPVSIWYWLFDAIPIPELGEFLSIIFGFISPIIFEIEFILFGIIIGLVVGKYKKDKDDTK